jgi:hypothetical protein
VVKIAGLGALALAFVGLLWLVWQNGQAVPGGYLYGMEGPEGEAGYCLAVVERVREITREQGARKLERFVDEQIVFWRARVKGQAVAGRMALTRDSGAPGVNEGAHLHLAIQDCGNRAVRLYGHRFASME